MAVDTPETPGRLQVKRYRVVAGTKRGATRKETAWTFDASEVWRQRVEYGTLYPSRGWWVQSEEEEVDHPAYATLRGTDRSMALAIEELYGQAAYVVGLLERGSHALTRRVAEARQEGTEARYSQTPQERLVAEVFSTVMHLAPNAHLDTFYRLLAEIATYRVAGEEAVAELRRAGAKDV